MTLRVIGLGVGRTGTLSMKTALERLGFGPCHHMDEVKSTHATSIALWTALAEGRGDIRSAYEGYGSAVDWPTAAFTDELYAAYPDARYLITARDPEKWYQSFSETIYALLNPAAETPLEMQSFVAMARAVVRKTGFPLPGTKEEMLDAYNRHIATVKAKIPANRLLVFEVSQGWGPLCRFLGVPVPAEEFPRTNTKQDFWDDLNSRNLTAQS